MTRVTTEPAHAGSVIVWGTYDLGKPRTRLLIKALESKFKVLDKIHADLWQGVEDKSQIKGGVNKLMLIVRWLLMYPKLIYCYLRAPKHQYVLLPYMGYLDLLFIWPFARLRGVTICVDIFISLYDTTVIDRQLLKPNSARAKLLYAFEWFVLRLADVRLIDTQTHARYVEQLFGLAQGKIDVVWVGAEQEVFSPLPSVISNEKTQVLFYGQFIPLHGLDVIVNAAEILANNKLAHIEFVIVGKGQLQTEIDGLIHSKGLVNVQRVGWVPYEQLNQLIADAAICLGVFAANGKALRVIPNKVYQVLAAKKPLITADTPAIRELITNAPWVDLVPSGDAEALANAILAMVAKLAAEAPEARSFPAVGVADIAHQLKQALA